MNRISPGRVRKRARKTAVRMRQTESLENTSSWTDRDRTRAILARHLYLTKKLSEDCGPVRPETEEWIAANMPRRVPVVSAEAGPARVAVNRHREPVFAVTLYRIRQGSEPEAVEYTTLESRQEVIEYLTARLGNPSKAGGMHNLESRTSEDVWIGDDGETFATVAYQFMGGI